MALQFDHAVIAVNDLTQAIADFRELGFNPFYGGEHAGGKTHNALIVFQDGTYLELLAPTTPALLENPDPVDHSNFLFLFAGGEGLVAYALHSDNLEADVTAMQSRGVAITLRPPNGRARPDGQLLQWRSAMLDDGSMSPFFIQDITPRTLRVTDDPTLTTQPNGIKGIRQITISTQDISDAVDQYTAMLAKNAEVESQDNVRLKLGGVSMLITTKPTERSSLTELQLFSEYTDKPLEFRTHGAVLNSFPNQ